VKVSVFSGLFGLARMLHGARSAARAGWTMINCTFFYLVCMRLLEFVRKLSDRGEVVEAVQ
jgi:hypothetical protein